MTIQIAHLYATLCLATIFFQIVAISGAPVAALAPGRAGLSGALAWPQRVLAGLSMPVFLLLALAVLSAAGFPGLGWPRWTAWAALGSQISLTALHFLSKAPQERRFWGPLGVTMTAMIGVVLTA